MMILLLVAVVAIWWLCIGMTTAVGRRVELKRWIGPFLAAVEKKMEKARPHT
jgi:hypothetical protein